MRISVLVPTYRRPADLSRCLSALAAQTRAPDEIVIVARPEDTDALALLKRQPDGLPLRTALIDRPGVVAQLNRGLSVCQGDIIAITDDDAAPRPDWLARIEAHFRDDPHIGAVGGRDFVDQDGVARERSRVGIVQWFGRTIGNHHLGVGPARPVDFLKGVNASYRRAAIAGLSFDERLRGDGAQYANDMAFSLAVNRRGWRVVYDPAVAVDHYPGIRHDSDRRGVFDPGVTADHVHNETVSLLDYLPPWRRFIFILWALIVGDRDGPGLLQWIRLTLAGDRHAGRKLVAALRGRFAGTQTARRQGEHDRRTC